jgi:hypothetical protein
MELFMVLFQDKCDQWLISAMAQLPRTETAVARLDRIFLVVFASAFFLFNFFFWGNIFND